MHLFPYLLRRLVRAGRLEMLGPNGFREVIDPPDAAGPDVVVRITTWAVDLRLLKTPSLGLAEAYLDGLWTLERGTVFDFFRLMHLPVAPNGDAPSPAPPRLAPRTFARSVNRALQRLPVRSQAYADQFGYDKGHLFFRSMLDDGLNFSCGYWAEGVETLAQAQLAKARHIAAKLAIQPGQRVLDIGCGWGSVSLYLATVCQAQVTAVSLSQDQLEVARARAQRLGVAERVEFRLQDYRAVPERFDRVVSVAMLEHVGRRNLGTYFKAVRDRLAPDGVALIHSITSKAPPAPASAFARKYFDAKGCAPSLSELFAAVEASGLWSLDCELLRLHYAKTLAAWATRLEGNRADVITQYDERVARLWEYYLGVAQNSFAHGPLAVAQVLLGPERDNVPLTRAYIEADKARLIAREQVVGWGAYGAAAQ